MEDFEEHALKLQKEFDTFGAQKAASLRPQVDRLMATLKQRGLPVPKSLRRVDAALRLDAEDDFFDNMPV
ncbi:MAG: hypothetical protein AB8B58_09420 [Roseobacter sp.]